MRLVRVPALVVAGGGCCCGGLPGTGVVAIIATESHVDSDVLLVSGVVGEDGGAACAAHSTGLFSIVVVVDAETKKTEKHNKTTRKRCKKTK